MKTRWVNIDDQILFSLDDLNSVIEGDIMETTCELVFHLAGLQKPEVIYINKEKKAEVLKALGDLLHGGATKI